MPYGAKGGDTPAKDKKIEKMVNAIMKHGHDKVSAIKIAKAQIARHHGAKK
jgi:hypothetical protein